MENTNMQTKNQKNIFMNFLSKEKINMSQEDYIFSTQQLKFTLSYSWEKSNSLCMSERITQENNYTVNRIKVSVNPHNNEITSMSLLTNENLDLYIKELMLGTQGKQDMYKKIINGFREYQKEELLTKISNFMIKQVQNNSVETGFQYIVSYDVIEKSFGITLDDNLKNELLEEIQSREEVTDVQEDKLGFDIVLGTSNAPNYNPDNFLNFTKKPNEFKYQMLGRLRSDCEYYLGFGNRCKKCLYYLDEQEHIDGMKELFNSFSDDEKPEWLTYEEILSYEKAMVNI